MQEVNTLNPAGKTPTGGSRGAGRRGARLSKKPGLIVVLTDGEETCGGSPCELGKNCTRTRHSSPSI